MEKLEMLKMKLNIVESNVDDKYYEYIRFLIKQYTQIYNDIVGLYYIDGIFDTYYVHCEYHGINNTTTKINRIEISKDSIIGYYNSNGCNKEITVKSPIDLEILYLNEQYDTQYYEHLVNNILRIGKIICGIK